MSSCGLLPAPRHIAIIMDGNGRWARSKGVPRIQGHRVGARNLRTLTTYCSDRGVEILTLYAFSHENWSRPSREVQLLMLLLKIFAVRERELLMKQNVRLKTIGDLSRIPDFARKELERTVEITKGNSKMILQLALSYGGQTEITRACKKIAEKVQAGELRSDQVTEDLVAQHLDTAGQPDPDLVIRTSGEQRISNFLLWQSAYSEFYFTPKFWPDFSAEDLEEAIAVYHRRERRFGGLKEQAG